MNAFLFKFVPEICQELSEPAEQSLAYDLVLLPFESVVNVLILENAFNIQVMFVDAREYLPLLLDILQELEDSFLAFKEFGFHLRVCLVEVLGIEIE